MRLVAVDGVRVLEAAIWPFVALLLAGIVLFSPPIRALFSSVIQRVTSLKGFGFEIDLTQDAANRASENIEDTFATYRRRINARFDSLSKTFQLDALLERLVEDEIVHRLSEVTKKDYRVTIHVPDVLFDGAMYQLLDYYPKGGGRGRTLSMRFGIVGRAWRLGASLLEENVDPQDRDRLIGQWAMTRREAAELGQGRHSFYCFLLRNGGNNPLGILYADSLEPNAFADVRQAETQIQDCCTDSGLIAGLTQTCRTMRSIGPQVAIFG